MKKAIFFAAAGFAFYTVAVWQLSASVARLECEIQLFQETMEKWAERNAEPAPDKTLDR